MIKPMTKEDTQRALERAKANRFDEYGNYGENNGPLPESEPKEEPVMIEWGYGIKGWYLKNGICHREDGPAIEYPNGEKEFWLNGEQVTEEEVMGKRWANLEWAETPTSFIPTVNAIDNVKTSDGGPSSYYDMPFQDWVTLNDQMEYLAQNKWGVYAIHLKDVFKGLGRWGDKEGTTPLYDTKKGIYYFCRVMKMMVGAEGLREYLQSILDDPQFKEDL